MKQETLKGEINYYKYVWVSSLNACDKCQALDGNEFNSIDEIPDLPHPNCKCYIDIVEDDKLQENEPCDCWEKIENILNQADELEGDVLSYKQEIDIIKEDIENEKEKFNSCLTKLKDKINELKSIDSYRENCISNNEKYEEIIDLTKYFGINTAIGTLLDIINKGYTTFNIFQNHKYQMETTVNSYDKYFHSKANCESAELGEIETMWAVVWSIGKECYDIPKKIIFQHMEVKKALNDSWEDLKADFYGIEKAKEYGSCSDKVKNIKRDLFEKE